MKDISSIESLVVPEGVTVAIKARTVTVEGPRGKLTKNVGHIQMDIQLVSRKFGRWSPGMVDGMSRVARAKHEEMARTMAERAWVTESFRRFRG